MGGANFIHLINPVPLQSGDNDSYYGLDLSAQRDVGDDGGNRNRGENQCVLGHGLAPLAWPLCGCIPNVKN